MNKVIKKLKKIMINKQTNLSISVDFTKTRDILDLVDKVGDSICMLKTHVDIIEDFSDDFIKKLKEKSYEKKFLIFEDRKFADIGNTVSLQFSKGIYKISNWADIINAHSIIGEGIIDGLKKVNKNSALILLAQMTPEGNLFTKDYMKKTIEMAKKYPDFVCGFIGSSDKPDIQKEMKSLIKDKFFIFTPGISLESKGDHLGQTYNTPKKAVENGSDIIIVGRGIYNSKDPRKEAEKYRLEAWNSYKNKLI
jgi:orotidine 5'-phosphate decarboxylase subfamily 1